MDAREIVLSLEEILSSEEGDKFDVNNFNNKHGVIHHKARARLTQYRNDFIDMNSRIPEQEEDKVPDFIQHLPRDRSSIIYFGVGGGIGYVVDMTLGAAFGLPPGVLTFAGTFMGFQAMRRLPSPEAFLNAYKQRNLPPPEEGQLPEIVVPQPRLSPYERSKLNLREETIRDITPYFAMKS